MENFFFQNYQWGSTLFDQSMIIEKKKIKKKKDLKKVLVHLEVGHLTGLHKICAARWKMHIG